MGTGIIPPAPRPLPLPEHAEHGDFRGVVEGSGVHDGQAHTDDGTPRAVGRRCGKRRPRALAITEASNGVNR